MRKHACLIAIAPIYVALVIADLVLLQNGYKPLPWWVTAIVVSILVAMNTVINRKEYEKK